MTYENPYSIYNEPECYHLEDERSFFRDKTVQLLNLLISKGLYNDVISFMIDHINCAYSYYLDLNPVDELMNIAISQPNSNDPYSAYGLVIGKLVYNDNVGEDLLLELVENNYLIRSEITHLLENTKYESVQKSIVENYKDSRIYNYYRNNEHQFPEVIKLIEENKKSL